MSYPVVAECWTIFESSLLSQARALVEDIAKHQGVEWKPLWAKVRPTIKIPLLEMNIPEQPLCIHSIQREDSVVLERCRAPCLIGFERCPLHMESKSKMNEQIEKEVDRIIDVEGNSYFVDAKLVVRDASGKVKGIVEDDVFYRFDTLTSDN
jgi:hypothetical protein